MSLAVLAGLSGLSVSFLSMIENGQRELYRKPHILALSGALRIAPVDLIPWVLPGPHPWPPSPGFPTRCDDVILARHRSLGAQLAGHVLGEHAESAEQLLRRLARDDRVNPWLLLDHLITQAAHPEQRGKRASP